MWFDLELESDFRITSGESGVEIDMKLDVHISKKTGDSKVTVTDREEHLCSESHKVANLVGRIVSDEEIGPEGDEVHETMV